MVCIGLHGFSINLCTNERPDGGIFTYIFPMLSHRTNQSFQLRSPQKKDESWAEYQPKFNGQVGDSGSLTTSLQYLIGLSVDSTTSFIQKHIVSICINYTSYLLVNMSILHAYFELLAPPLSFRTSKGATSKSVFISKLRASKAAVGFDRMNLMSILCHLVSDSGRTWIILQKISDCNIRIDWDAAQALPIAMHSSPLVAKASPSPHSWGSTCGGSLCTTILVKEEQLRTMRWTWLFPLYYIIPYIT